MIGDTLGSVGVITSSLLIHYFHYTMADAICSLCISFLIVMFVLPLIKDTSHILLNGFPEPKENSLRDCLLKVASLEGVVSYRLPRFWQQSETEMAGVLCVTVKKGADSQRVLNAVSAILKDKRSGLGVAHLAVQIELEGGSLIETGVRSKHSDSSSSSSPIYV